MNEAGALRKVAQTLENLDSNLLWALAVWIFLVTVGIGSRVYFIWSQRGIDEKVKRLERLGSQLKKHRERRQKTQGCSKSSKKRKSKKKGRKGKKEGISQQPVHVAIDMSGFKPHEQKGIKVCAASVEKKSQNQEVVLMPTSTEVAIKCGPQVAFVHLKEDNTQNSTSSEKSNLVTARSTSEKNVSEVTAKSSSDSALGSSLLVTIRPEAAPAPEVSGSMEIEAADLFEQRGRRVHRETKFFRKRPFYVGPDFVQKYVFWHQSFAGVDDYISRNGMPNADLMEGSVPVQDLNLDPFAARCFHLSYSLNKKKRWLIEDLMAEQMEKYQTETMRITGLTQLFTPLTSLENYNRVNPYEVNSSAVTTRYHTVHNGEVVHQYAKNKHASEYLRKPRPPQKKRHHRRLTTFEEPEVDDFADDEFPLLQSEYDEHVKSYERKIHLAYVVIKSDTNKSRLNANFKVSKTTREERMFRLFFDRFGDFHYGKLKHRSDRFKEKFSNHWKMKEFNEELDNFSMEDDGEIDSDVAMPAKSLDKMVSLEEFIVTKSPSSKRRKIRRKPFDGYHPHESPEIKRESEEDNIASRGQNNASQESSKFDLGCYQLERLACDLPAGDVCDRLPTIPPVRLMKLPSEDVVVIRDDGNYLNPRSMQFAEQVYHTKAVKHEKSIVSEMPSITKLVCKNTQTVNSSSAEKFALELFNEETECSKTVGAHQMQKPEEECGICLEEGFQMALASCGHFSCVDCWTHYAARSIHDNRVPLRCPGGKCSEVVPIAVMRSFIRQEMDDFLLCRRCDKFVFAKKSSARILICECGAAVCRRCREEAHEPLSCENMRKYEDMLKRNGQSFHNAEFAHIANGVKCPRCAALVDRTEGCNHVACICGFEFCYACHRPFTVSHYECTTEVRRNFALVDGEDTVHPTAFNWCANIRAKKEKTVLRKLRTKWDAKTKGREKNTGMAISKYTQILDCLERCYVHLYLSYNRVHFKREHRLAQHFFSLETQLIFVLKLFEENEIGSKRSELLNAATAKCNQLVSLCTRMPGCTVVSTSSFEAIQSAEGHKMRSLLTFARGVSYLPRQKNHYEILEVSRDAPADEIKRAFVRKTNELHPDGNAFSPAKIKSNRGVKKSETERFMELKAAYDVLRRPEKRKEYDRELHWSSEASASMFYEQESKPSFGEIKLNVKGLQMTRNRHYSGPSQKPAGHFYDPNDEIKREEKQKHFVASIGLVLGSLFALNALYIWFQSKKKRELESSRPVPLDVLTMNGYSTFISRRFLFVTSPLRRTYYEILGVDKTATTKEIKNAYYTLSKKYHPDVTGASPGSSSALKFVEVSDAYDVLKDTEKRRIYDSQISSRGYSAYSYDHAYPGHHRRRTYTDEEMMRIWKQYQDATQRNSHFNQEWPFGSNRYGASRRPGKTFFYRSGPGWSYFKETFTDKDGRQHTKFTYTDDLGRKRTVTREAMAVNWDFLAKIFKIYMVAFFIVTLFQVTYYQFGSSISSNTEAKRQAEAVREQQERINRMMGTSRLSRTGCTADKRNARLPIFLTTTVGFSTTKAVSPPTRVIRLVCSAYSVMSIRKASSLLSLPARHICCPMRCASTARSHYDVLGITSDVSSYEVERAYLKHLRMNHYSRGNPMSLGSIMEHREKRKAYYILRHKETRETYNEHLSEGQPAGTFDHDCLALPLDLIIEEDKVIHEDELKLRVIEEEIYHDRAVQKRNFCYAACFTVLLAAGIVSHLQQPMSERT
ncbi:hypothetical protein QR680_005861 [Steinernema hermaphroditum]|uniref:J domain-containing protein n=1 Tax=Steinernema hermaphroditum TaxID=289476 RepID=A0AA39HVY0_9BILA|nr:hypothetical protein QR680_005861 [Steinernema hermaphroditum]